MIQTSCSEIMLRDIISVARARCASDLHLMPHGLPYLRVDNQLESIEGFDTSMLLEVLTQRAAMTGTTEQELKVRGDSTMMCNDASGVMRVHVWREGSGMCAAVRFHDHEIRDFEGLGLPSVTRDLLCRPHGLLIFSGPTGSGKSTSLFSGIQDIARTRAIHIMTIEDPIEIPIIAEAALVHRREIGRDVLDYATAIYSAMRSDPDIIVIGEMRGAETFHAALRAAETGHLVVSTLHASSCSASIDRIIDSFPASRAGEIRSRIAASLTGIINQRLLRKPDGGRLLVAECLVANDAARALIREAKTHQLGNLIATSRAQGMQSMASVIERARSHGEIDNSESAA